jgi:hypothetical protein
MAPLPPNKSICTVPQISNKLNCASGEGKNTIVLAEYLHLCQDELNPSKLIVGQPHYVKASDLLDGLSNFLGFL